MSQQKLVLIFEETQSITIENNIDITFTLNFKMGDMVDSRAEVKGFDITNDFSFNLKTGATNLGARTIQDSSQTSDVTSDQLTSWSSKTGYEATTSSTAENESKFTNSMKVAFGPGGNVVFIILICVAVLLFFAYITYCRRNYVCRNVGIPGKVCGPAWMLPKVRPDFSKLDEGEKGGNYLKSKLTAAQRNIEENARRQERFYFR